MIQSNVIELMIQRPTNTDPESIQGPESESSSSQDRELESRPRARINIELIDKSRCNPTRRENPDRNYGKVDLSWVSHYIFLIIFKVRPFYYKGDGYYFCKHQVFAYIVTEISYTLILKSYPFLDSLIDSSCLTHKSSSFQL